MTFEALVAAAMAAPLEGWRFPFLDERLERDAPSWDWAATGGELLRDARTAMDHGTGGGEVLADVLAAAGRVPALTIATEGYPPNVAVASRRLRPLGVSVVHIHGGTFNSHGPGPATRRMPFVDGWLDAFLIRNGAFCPIEVFRMLRPGGRLLFQAGMVGPPRPGHVELRDQLGSTFDPGWGEWDVRATVLAAGFQVDDYREQLLCTRYLDIAAVVFSLRMVPWAVGPFSLEQHEGRLRELHEQIERDGPLVTGSTALFLRATRPPA